MPDLVTLATPMADVLLDGSPETTLVASALAALAALAVRVRRLAPGPGGPACPLAPGDAQAGHPAPGPLALVGPLAGGRRPAFDGPARSAEESRRRPATGDPGRRSSWPTSDPARSRPRPRRSRPRPRGPGDPGPIAGARLPTALAGARGRGSPSAWLVGSVVLAVGQARRVLRFRRLLRDAAPAPAWLIEEAEAVRPPPGRPRARGPRRPPAGHALALVPGPPRAARPRRAARRPSSADRWRAIVAHELAHLRRGDHWVRRLELVAGLVWWWNPLYWLARRRLDFEAELACDAWAVWAPPEDRLSYAESLIRICSALSPAGSPRPRWASPGPADPLRGD